MIRHVIGILLIALGFILYIFVDKKEIYCSDRFEINIFNRWQIPSKMISIALIIIAVTGIYLLTC